MIKVALDEIVPAVHRDGHTQKKRYCRICSDKRPVFYVRNRYGRKVVKTDKNHELCLRCWQRLADRYRVQPRLVTVDNAGL